MHISKHWAQYIVPLLLILLISACAPIVPATTPPQLEFTPGAPITIDEASYDAGEFTVQYPQGWRVIKNNTAEVPMSAVFVSPDETMAIFLSLDEQAIFSIPEDHQQQETTQIALENGSQIAIAASATDEQWDALQPIIQRVITSVNS